MWWDLAPRCACQPTVPWCSQTVGEVAHAQVRSCEIVLSLVYDKTTVYLRCPKYYIKVLSFYVAFSRISFFCIIKIHFFIVILTQRFPFQFLTGSPVISIHNLKINTVKCLCAWDYWFASSPAKHGQLANITTKQMTGLWCSECGWKGHRDIVGAISICRRTGLMVTVKEPRESELLDPWKATWDGLIWKAMIRDLWKRLRENRTPWIAPGGSQEIPS
jgi:hypothetical protein